jgi:hypothetical protein
MLFFSHDSAATIAHVIPSMDQINTMFHDAGTMVLTPSVRHALIFAHKLLNKYYSKTDLSNVYHVAKGISSLHLYHCTSNSYATAYSSPPTTKTQVLPATWLGEGMDHHS